jgi:hypothetical protein
MNPFAICLMLEDAEYPYMPLSPSVARSGTPSATTPPSLPLASVETPQIAARPSTLYGYGDPFCPHCGLVRVEGTISSGQKPPTPQSEVVYTSHYHYWACSKCRLIFVDRSLWRYIGDGEMEPIRRTDHSFVVISYDDWIPIGIEHRRRMIYAKLFPAPPNDVLPTAPDPALDQARKEVAVQAAALARAADEIAALKAGYAHQGKDIEFLRGELALVKEQRDGAQEELRKHKALLIEAEKRAAECAHWKKQWQIVSATNRQLTAKLPKDQQDQNALVKV